MPPPHFCLKVAYKKGGVLSGAYGNHKPPSTPSVNLRTFTAHVKSPRPFPSAEKKKEIESVNETMEFTHQGLVLHPLAHKTNQGPTALDPNPG